MATVSLFLLQLIIISFSPNLQVFNSCYLFLKIQLEIESKEECYYKRIVQYFQISASFWWQVCQECLEL